MESISMRIANQNIASIRNINSVRKTGNFFIAYTILECTIFMEDRNTMALEVTHVKVIVWNKMYTIRIPSCCRFLNEWADIITSDCDI